MTSVLLSSLNGLRPDTDRANLPSLAGRAGVRCLLASLLESINKRVEPGEAADAICVGLEHLDPQSLHIRHRGKGSNVRGACIRPKAVHP